MSEMRASYPHYEMAKNKVQLTPGMLQDDLIKKLQEKYADENVNTIDGL